MKKRPTITDLHRLLDEERFYRQQMETREEERSNVVQVVEAMVLSQIALLNGVRKMLHQVDTRARNDFDDEVPF